MHISHWAEVQPDTPAAIVAGTGETVTFRALEDNANRGARLLRKLGLQCGDVFALWSGNNPRFLEIAATMSRTGLYMVPVASKLRAGEAAYIIDDSGAKLLIVDATLKHAPELAARLDTLCPKVGHVFAIRDDLPGLPRWEDAIAQMPAIPIADPSAGQQMMYSSGTTGKPKGVQRPLSDAPHDAPSGFGVFMQHRYKTRPGTTFLVSAPLYHAGPFSMATTEQNLGATVLLFEHFDAEEMLAGIERYRPERGQFVPTMFVRLLKLPEGVRARYDVSSLRLAIHSAGPCPVEVKRRMIAWWGPVLDEIYGGTENVGSTMIDSHEWLRKPGSVGKGFNCTIHICDDEGKVLPPGETGTIWFEGGAAFRYLGDPDKTRESFHPGEAGWATFGDIGRVDEDGYLFLSDRKAFMIICGGVNVYPQEVEDLLALHPAVADVAVFGVPDADMGEQVKAIVAPADWSAAGPALEAELIAYCMSRLATLKCPKSVAFERELPRDAGGKLAKKALRDRHGSGLAAFGQ